MNSQMFAASRRQLHAAVQLIASVGAALAPSQPQGRQRAFIWDAGRSRCVGVKIPGVYPFCIALQPQNLSLLVLDDQETVIAKLPLVDKTLNTALGWLKRELARLGAEIDGIELLESVESSADNPVLRGAAFGAGSPENRRLLAAYFANTQPLQRTVAASHTGTSMPSTWPRNFNLQTQIVLPAAEAAPLQSIQVGLSPGSEHHEAPYWYIQPWPSPVPDLFNQAIDGCKLLLLSSPLRNDR